MQRRRLRTIYRYYNRRPDGKEREDCVCRAISTATNLNYQGVENLLKITARIYGCSKLCMCCYHHLLEDILCYPVFQCREGETVEDIAKRHKGKILIIRIDGHLTCSIAGVVPDIWDCTQKRLTYIGL